MKIALSTNWCNARFKSGEEIADSAKELGFDALELGFNTTEEQVAGFRARLDEMPVDSVHAFCPVPLSAPYGHPELYQLASADDGAAELAAVYVKKNIEFAASIGATALVLHAGRVNTRGFLKRGELKRRIKRGAKIIDRFKKTLEGIVPSLEAHGVRIGLEDLPYLEGFPAEWEVTSVVGDWVMPWLDTGHDHVRKINGWNCGQEWGEKLLGVHLNDSNGGDDHLPPGDGKVDFLSLKPKIIAARHLVMEPNAQVDEAGVKRGLDFVRKLVAS